MSWGFDEDASACISLKKELRKEILKAILQGYTHFVSGMALGIDTYAAEIVLELKESHEIFLECAIPCDGQARYWAAAQKVRYENILSQCDELTKLSKAYTPFCMMARNMYMVDKSSLLIAVYDQTTGGTASTVAYARKRGVRIALVAHS